MVLAPMAGRAAADSASHRRSVGSRRRTPMLAPSLATSWTTAHRFCRSRSDSATGSGELSLGCSADPRRIAETRLRHFGAHRLALSERRPENPVANLADVPLEPFWPGIYPAADDGCGRRS